MFSPSAYYLAVCASAFLITWSYPVIFGLLSFYFYDFAAHSFLDCLQFTFLLWLIGMAGCYTGITFGTFIDNHMQAIKYLELLSILFFMCSGVFANTGESGSSLVYYLSFISPSRYICELTLRRELVGKD